MAAAGANDGLDAGLERLQLLQGDKGLHGAGKTAAVEGYVRVSYCVSPDMIERALPAFKALAESYKK